ncbi:acyloxyacyl hydrolase isoform X2 [Myotis myotis]|uniref:Acyloxyacyl hydrolase n=1 Tax=Myotis myotis TaxID=51298 RepID=A0A7J7V2E2_MYOMY|nr:acyloxyacyl hydrolase isoform X2 [Myotis myotis]KAF6319156.1 acyloxyacyl hydrolase [Myotis myotis]
MKSPRKVLLVAPLLLLLPFHTSASAAHDDQPGARPSKGHTCVGCVLVVSVIKQLAQVHNSTVQASMERLCSYLPEKLFLKATCYLAVRTFGPDIIKLLSADMNADVVCHTLEFCHQGPGQALCHLYPLPKEAWKVTLEKARQIVKRSPTLKYPRGGADICSLPFLAKICQKIKRTITNSVPFRDVDSDNYSVSPTLRGYHWRGRDCNDSDKMAYPGRRPDRWDEHRDSNCNGIWGVDPKDGIPYEKKFCEGSEPRGIVLLGDSAGAHFHIPLEWITASQMSLKSFFNLPTALTDELDWPQLSGATGFLNATSGIKENSIYLHLRKRNRCNHRDYQNISKNGASSQNLETFIERNPLLDQPAIVIYAMIGNDVCNGKSDPVPEMTTPEQFYSKVMETLKYLNARLPNGSHVILYGLPDGTFLWDHLHSRHHPLGQLNGDVTYGQLYTFLSCLQVSPCHGWMTANETLRTLTSQRAALLSNTLKKIATSQKFTSFHLYYVDFDFQEIIKKWQKRGGQPWQLLEPVDGFHPNEVALLLLADDLWDKVRLQWPQVLGKENPFNAQIEQVFGDQGGH